MEEGYGHLVVVPKKRGSIAVFSIDSNVLTSLQAVIAKMP